MRRRSGRMNFGRKSLKFFLHWDCGKLRDSLHEHHYVVYVSCRCRLWHVKCVGDHTDNCVSCLAFLPLAAALAQSLSAVYSLQQLLFINHHLCLPRQGRGPGPSQTTASTVETLVPFPLPILVLLVQCDTDTGPTLRTRSAWESHD